MLKLSRPILLALLHSALTATSLRAQTAEVARAELARRRLIFDLKSEGRSARPSPVLLTRRWTENKR
ncbi:MAG TPA: hypothetical protein VM911_23050 [Pyrinomonadaceae bacterium]|nr:hypothetical protein [Pyrinomonadaceae bacterium]